MEGKSVIMTVLLLSLVIGQIQVEAKRICCQTTTANSCFNMCRMAPWACAERCECKFIPDDEVCVVDNHDILKNTGQIQDEAKRICCKTTTANGCFNMCRMAPWACAEKCGCEFIPNDEVCVVDNHDILKNTGQVQVEAKRICCQTTTANSCFNMCRMAPWACAERCECKFIPDDEVCVVDNQNILKNTGDDAFNEYCKLGCVSSVCGAMTTLQNSDASEVVNGAVEKCTKACSAFCTKGSIAAVKVEIA